MTGYRGTAVARDRSCRMYLYSAGAVTGHAGCRIEVFERRVPGPHHGRPNPPVPIGAAKLTCRRCGKQKSSAATNLRRGTGRVCDLCLEGVHLGE